MRRLMLAALGIMALALAVPGAALAHKGHHHNKGHHHAKRKARHASIRFEHFGAFTASEPTGTGTATGTVTSGSTTSTGSTRSTTPENAGTVVSYTNGVLKLELSNKSMVEGNVTAGTEIQCVKAAATSTTPSGGEPSDQSPGDDSGQGDDQSRGDMSQQGDQQSSSSGEPQQGEDGQDSSDDDVEAQSTSAPEAPCDTSALTLGTVVRSAELRIGPSGSEFESLVLVR